ncbi:MAG: ATP-binding protein [Bacteroidia bacterium]|nr:ATP-binding protein [Bacteroidia bacterium]
MKLPLILKCLFFAALSLAYSPKAMTQVNPLVWHIPSAEYQLEGKGLSPRIQQFLQMNDGRMLLCNTTGVLSFDGRVWNLVPGTVGSRFRLALGSDGLVYGCNNQDLGTIEADSIGGLSFRSLISHLPDSLPLQDIFQVVASDGEVHFLSDEFIFTWHIGLARLLVRKSPGTILNSTPSPDGQGLWLVLKNGLYVLGPQQGHWLQSRSLEGIGEVRNAFLETGSSETSYSLLLVSLENGLWAISPSGLRPYRQDLTQKFPDRIWHSTLLHTGDLALATNQSGILLLERKTKTIRQLGVKDGLPEGAINQVFEDAEHGMWIAGETSVSRVPYPLPLTLLGEDAGIGGMVTAILPGKDRVLVGTTRGLFLADTRVPNEPIRFSQIAKDIYEVWDISQGRDGVWIAASSGLFLWNEGKLSTFCDELVMSVKESRFDPNLVVAGLYDGVGTLTKVEGQWTWQGKLAGYNARTQSLLESKPGEWWLAYKTLTRARGIGQSEEITFKAIDRRQGWDDNMRTMNLWLHDETVHLGCDLGLFQLKENPLKLIPVVGWNAALPTEYAQSNIAIASKKGGFWVYNGRYIGKMISKEGKYRWENSLLSGVRTDVWEMYEDENEILWIGTNNGLLTYNSTQELPGKLPFRAYIREVLVQGDSLVQIPVDLTPNVSEFPHGVSDMLFNYGAIGFTFPSLFQFQWKLEGYDADWSPWSKLSEREKYTRLEEGDYTFRVRAKNLFGQVSEEASFSFSILPPWYRRWWVFLIYFLIFSAIVVFIVQVRTRTSRKRLEAKERELALERRTTERLRAIDQLKDQFLANTSHELKTPLNGIIGLSESMLAYHDDPETQNNLSLIVSSGKRLQSLVDDILDFSKLKSHEITLQLKPVDLHAIAEVVIHLQRPLLADKSLDLHNLIPTSLPVIMADESRIMQVFHNLVGNAIKFTESGEVTIRGKMEDDFIYILVEDTGIGISPGDQKKIFQAFEQADGSIERNYAGTGLGLTISKQLIELHGGKLTVTSTPGTGSVFSFTLPARIASPEAAKSNSNIEVPQQTVTHLPRKEKVNFTRKASLPTSQRLMRILIVDDEEINQEVMKAHLAEPEYELVVASRGAEALEILKTDNDFDLVLLDVMMPGMSGFEVCRIIRQTYLPSELPVIIITAKDQIEDLVQAFSTGANDYLAKPFSRAEFLARVKTQLYLQHIHQATRKFVPHEFLHALGYEAITESKYGDQVAKMGTVMFADIRNYTAIAEQLGPEDTFLFLNAYYSRMGPVIRENHGFINHFFGDGIMALFLDSTEHAAKAAIGMQKALEAYNVDRQERGFPALNIGIGLHTGQLMMGMIGDGKRMDTGLVSDAVNLCSRLEGLTKILGTSILISGESYVLLSDDMAACFRFIGKIQVRGKAIAIDVYECIAGMPESVMQLRSQSHGLMKKAFAHFEKKELEKAIALYDQIIDLDPEDKPTSYLREEIYSILTSGKANDWAGFLEMKDK